MTTREILLDANRVKPLAAFLTTEKKNAALFAMADELISGADDILSENARDMKEAEGKISPVMLDRLRLTKDRIEGMAEGIDAYFGI